MVRLKPITHHQIPYPPIGYYLFIYFLYVASLENSNYSIVVKSLPYKGLRRSQYIYNCAKELTPIAITT